MGYISQNMELDAILTKKGRELLTNNPGAFKITKFSLSDDEVDYRLWNTDHAAGTDYYGEVIENTPIIEPLPGEEQQAKFNLITMPKETTNMPRLVIGSDTVELRAGQEYIVQPQSIPTTFNITQGYFATVWDFDGGLFAYAEDYLPGDNSVSSNTIGTSVANIADPNAPQTMTSRGYSFKLVAGEFEDSLDHIYRLTIRGNEDGARATMVVTVKGKYTAQPRA